MKNFGSLIEIESKFGKSPPNEIETCPPYTGLWTRLVMGYIVPILSKFAYPALIRDLNCSSKTRIELSFPATLVSLDSNYPNLALRSPIDCLITLKASPLLSEIA